MNLDQLQDLSSQQLEQQLGLSKGSGFEIFSLLVTAKEKMLPGDDIRLVKKIYASSPKKHEGDQFIYVFDTSKGLVFVDTVHGYPRETTAEAVTEEIMQTMSALQQSIQEITSLQ